MVFANNEKLVHGSSIGRLVKMKHSGLAITYVFCLHPYATLQYKSIMKKSFRLFLKTSSVLT